MRELISDPQQDKSNEEEDAQHRDRQVDTADLNGLAKQIQSDLAGRLVTFCGYDTDYQRAKDRSAFGENVIQTKVFAGVLRRNDLGVVGTGQLLSLL